MANRHHGGGEGSTSLDDFKQLCLLGEGAFSAVYKVLRLADGGTYALKKVKLPSLSDKEKQNALNEIRVLASVHHENIISYKEAFFDDKSRCLCIVTECADMGDLLAQIVKCQKERSHLPESTVWRYFLGMNNGLRALHNMKILHRDMKSANIFLSNAPDGIIAKLGDFNVSAVAKRGLCMTQTGTPYYASPEVWRDMPYDAKSDMWSLGCVLYEAVALKPPFQAKDMEGLYRAVLKGQYPRIPGHYSQELSDLIGALLQVNPRHRPSAEQLMSMPAVQHHSGQLSPLAAEVRPSELLGTIKVPRGIIDLSGYLPKPQYDVASPAISGASDGGAKTPQSTSAARRNYSVGCLAPPSLSPGGGLPRSGRGLSAGPNRRRGQGGAMDPLPALPRPQQPAAQDSLDMYMEQAVKQPPPPSHPSPEKRVPVPTEQPRRHHSPVPRHQSPALRHQSPVQQERDPYQPSRNCYDGRRPTPQQRKRSVSEQAGRQPRPVQREQRRPLMANYARAQYQLDKGMALPKECEVG